MRIIGRRRCRRQYYLIRLATLRAKVAGPRTHVTRTHRPSPRHDVHRHVLQLRHIARSELPCLGVSPGQLRSPPIERCFPQIVPATPGAHGQPALRLTPMPPENVVQLVNKALDGLNHRARWCDAPSRRLQPARCHVEQLSHRVAHGHRASAEPMRPTRSFPQAGVSDVLRTTILRPARRG